MVFYGLSGQMSASDPCGIAPVNNVTIPWMKVCNVNFMAYRVELELALSIFIAPEVIPSIPHEISALWGVGREA